MQRPLRHAVRAGRELLLSAIVLLVEELASGAPPPREAEASCTAYDEHPLDQPDECGDLASFRAALVAPCTTTIRGLVSEVGLEPGEDPVPRRCVVYLDSVERAPVATLV